jgi:hypothetical protein
LHRKESSVILICATFSILLLGFSTGSINVPEDSLVEHWTFDEKGNVTIDNSDFESNGQLMGNSNLANGIVGKGFWEYARKTYFDGYNDVRIYNVALNDK